MANRKSRVYVIIREVSTDEIRIGCTTDGPPNPDPNYRCHGPFRSLAAAKRAFNQHDSTAWAVLYGDGPQYVRGPQGNVFARSWSP